MSRQYDAKQTTLKVCPNNRKLGVELFLEYLDVSEEDFHYDEGMSAEEYIYGKAQERSKDGESKP